MFFFKAVHEAELITVLLPDKVLLIARCNSGKMLGLPLGHRCNYNSLWAPFVTGIVQLIDCLVALLACIPLLIFLPNQDLHAKIATDSRDIIRFVFHYLHGLNTVTTVSSYCSRAILFFILLFTTDIQDFHHPHPYHQNYHPHPAQLLLKPPTRI
jgi:hypothetical protein